MPVMRADFEGLHTNSGIGVRVEQAEWKDLIVSSKSTESNNDRQAIPIPTASLLLTFEQVPSIQLEQSSLM